MALDPTPGDTSGTPFHGGETAQGLRLSAEAEEGLRVSPAATGERREAELGDPRQLTGEGTAHGRPEGPKR